MDDIQELNRLMDSYGGALLGTCYVILRDYHLAQDVVQETFIKAWHNGNVYRDTEKAWLTRVAVNGCRDVLRSRWRRWLDRSVIPEELPAGAEEIQENELLDQVLRLPREERAAIVMHYWNDMGAEEIAGVLRISRATVYRRLESARRRLRIELEEEVE